MPMRKRPRRPPRHPRSPTLPRRPRQMNQPRKPSPNRTAPKIKAMARPSQEPEDSEIPDDDQENDGEDDDRPKRSDPDDDGYKQVEILLHAIETIRQKYVDEDKVSYERLMEAALEGMFSSLDPHSSYMHRRLFEQMQKSQSNSYEGIGITISFKENLLRIVSVPRTAQLPVPASSQAMRSSASTTSSPIRSASPRRSTCCVGNPASRSNSSSAARPPRRCWRWRSSAR